MPTPLETLIACGTKLWLDSVDPSEVVKSRGYGATGATSNPSIIAGLIKSGDFEAAIRSQLATGRDDESIAWKLTDDLVRRAQDVFLDVYDLTNGDDGYVSFELDPLLEDAQCELSLEERRDRYIELGRKWAAGHRNRMIKVPATPAGLAALEELAADGVTLNVTLIFTEQQYIAARDAVWRGAQRRESLDGFKSVFSVFVSRIDVYTQQRVHGLSDAAQGQVGVVNAKRISLANAAFWSDKNLPLKQEIVFASTGTKDPADPIDRYLKSLAGSDIQTNPPEMNAAIQQATGTVYTKAVDRLPPQSVLDEIDARIDWQQLEDVLMSEGLGKFADPQKGLIALIGEKRSSIAAA